MGVTSIRELLPCNRSGGIGYPLADGPFRFDSGELGYGPTISQSLYASGGGAESLPITAAIDIPTDRANCDAVPGLVKLVSDGCVGTPVWKTPANLPTGTYSYFCRVHPFMRGAFRVVKNRA